MLAHKLTSDHGQSQKEMRGVRFGVLRVASSDNRKQEVHRQHSLFGGGVGDWTRMHPPSGCAIQI